MEGPGDIAQGRCAAQCGGSHESRASRRVAIIDPETVNPEQPRARSSATTVDEYLAELPAERRDVIARVRDVVRKHLPEGYEEAVNRGAISWEIPLARYPKTYNKQPLSFVGLCDH